MEKREGEKERIPWELKISKLYTDIDFWKIKPQNCDSEFKILKFVASYFYFQQNKIELKFT